MKKVKIVAPILASILFLQCKEQQKETTNALSSAEITSKVNVFLGSSGDYGQMSPSASSPNNMISIGPVTNPGTHTGYDHYAKEFLGFVHTHIEGVGCQGGGGNILVKPLGSQGENTKLIKEKETASPGYYKVGFSNEITAEMTVAHNYGAHHYQFPKGEKSLLVDISNAFLNRFVQEEHQVKGNSIQGWVETKTVCDRGIYRIYFYITFDNQYTLEKLDDHRYVIHGTEDSDSMDVQIGFSSVSEAFAKEKVAQQKDFNTTKKETAKQWEALLSTIEVSGEKDREDLFYSLLYRGLQAPYLVSEKDGTYRAINGSTQTSANPVFSGWAIWDNYREQMPLLSLVSPAKYGDIAASIANLYAFGKNDWSTKFESSNTVRTEHAMVVLLDAMQKGHSVPLEKIKDSLILEASRLDTGAPDKALESSYDYWAIAKLMESLGDKENEQMYLEKAKEYVGIWQKDFEDMTRNDVDRMGARGLYQGTLWQYRWFVPFDVAGLKELIGGDETYTKQLDQFFAEFNYNQANQPDLQVPGMYNASKQPWKSQKLFRNIMLDTVTQFYFNNNSKGIDPYIGRIYKNQPRAYIRTMDDDLGTMSSWFVLRAMGLSAANVGEPIYYLTAPIFKTVSLHGEGGKSFNITVKNYNKDHFYIQSATLNGEELKRNWLTHKEIMDGGELILEVSDTPNKSWGIENQWISSLKK